MSMADLAELKRRERQNKEQAKKIREAIKLASGERTPYDHKAHVAAKSREATRATQEIGTIPPVKDPIRRRDCLADFELFCKTYGTEAFYLDWADTHKRSAANIQRAAMYGGQYAYAEPRGSGKTTRAMWGTLWAVLSGIKLYVPVIAANKELGLKLLDGIKLTLLKNQLLYEDFPHVCHAVRHCKGEARAAGGQRYKGESTHLVWAQERIVLPWVIETDSLCPGAVIESYGLETAIRGLTHTRPDGSVIRPSLAICDDPQTRASAKSPSQTQTRWEILNGDVAYLSGPDQPMSIVVPCTIVYQGDLADQLTNRESHPEWHGERTKMVESFPENQPLWDTYAEIIRADWDADGNGEKATEFYRQNFDAMNAGAKVYWPQRHLPGEIHGIQHAMNRKIKNEEMFFAECQNEPVTNQDEFELLTADEIVHKITNYGRGEIPGECSALTVFSDVQDDHLFWMLCGWTPEFTGFIVDYGAWPDQRRNYFTRRDVSALNNPNRLSRKYLGDESGILFQALTDLGKKLCGQKYTKTDGKEIAVGRWCIDVGYRSTPVGAYAAQSEFKSIIARTRGKAVKATAHTPFNEAVKAKKWRTTHGHWFWMDGPGPAQPVMFDTNWWKSRVHKALVLGTQSRGSIQLFKATTQVHRMLADHLLAEKPVKTEANNRQVWEWHEIPGRDNEGLDCLVGCAVAASICGIVPDTERIHQKRTVVMTPQQYRDAAKRRQQ